MDCHQESYLLAWAEGNFEHGHVLGLIPITPGSVPVNPMLDKVLRKHFQNHTIVE